MSNQASPGDTNNALLRKILASVAAAAGSVTLPRPGDTDNALLRKIADLLSSGSSSGESNPGGGANIYVGTGAPSGTSGAQNGDTFINNVNGDVYIYNSTTNTWVLQTSTTIVGNVFSVASGTPSGATGKDGDFYLDSSTGVFWEKSAGVWADTGARYAKPLAASTLTYAASVALDFSGDDYKTVSLTGDITFTTSNRAAAKALTVRILADGSTRTFTFPGDWTWVGSTAPASIAANKVGILSVTSFGTTDADVVAAYAVEP